MKEIQKRNHLKEYSHMKEAFRDTTGDTFKKQQSREFPDHKEHLKQKNYNDIRDAFKGEQYKDKQDFRCEFLFAYSSNKKKTVLINFLYFV